MLNIASGVIMRIGTYDTAIYPNRTQREVHPARRDEAISYRILSDQKGVHTTSVDGMRWDHYRYQFVYRYLGEAFRVTWSCGVAYGDPNPEDGLKAMFLDAETVRDEAFGTAWMDEYGFDSEYEAHTARRSYKAAERHNNTLDRIFQTADNREDWHGALTDTSARSTSTVTA